MSSESDVDLITNALGPSYYAKETPEIAAERAQQSRTDNPMWDLVRQIPQDFLLSNGNRYSPRSFNHPDHPGGNEQDLRRSSSPTRHYVCWQYAWAISDPASLEFVAEYAMPTVVEIGAGTGYWAWQLHQLGVQVHAYDIAPPNRLPNHWHRPRTDGMREATDNEDYKRSVFFPVEQGDANRLRRHADDILFLCWPPYGGVMATEALQTYPGERVIYIGEHQGGCTADDDFFELLADQWHQTASHHIVQWSGIRDQIRVFERS